MKYPCGCRNRVDPTWGVLRNWRKCRSHRRFAANMDRGLAYYAALSGENGLPGHAMHISQLKEAIQSIGRVPRRAASEEMALEVGCGMGLYIPWLLRLGYAAEGLEPNEAAAGWVRSVFDVPVHGCPIESFDATSSYSVVVAAHVFEHLPHAPDMMRKVRQLLAPGGVLYLIVPDDSDPVNPDHFWFFNLESLQRTLEKVGFQNVAIAVRRYVAHENFLYAAADVP